MNANFKNEEENKTADERRWTQMIKELSSFVVAPRPAGEVGIFDHNGSAADMEELAVPKSFLKFPE